MRETGERELLQSAGGMQNVMYTNFLNSLKHTKSAIIVSFLNCELNLIAKFLCDIKLIQFAFLSTSSETAVKPWLISSIKYQKLCSLLKLVVALMHIISIMEPFRRLIWSFCESLLNAESLFDILISLRIAASVTLTASTS